MTYAPEANAKPLAIVVPRPSERAEFDALSKSQQGYFLHWVRSNQKFDVWPRNNWWKRGMRKAREQRP